MQPIHLAVDVHGGDFGVGVFVDGILEAQQCSETPLKIYVCGEENQIQVLLHSRGWQKRDGDEDIIVVNCPVRVNEKDIPSRVWKNRKESSIVRCISLQKDGVVHASLSAGDTRILIGTSMFLLGRSKDVSRPALAALLPTTSLRPTLLLDVGANLDCRKEHLVSFGLMGYNYARYFFSIDNPSVALLNVGAESSKGTKTIVEAAKILAGKCRGYHGFIEGGRVLSGDADVVVCDGFMGNVLLKACESFHSLTETVLKGNQKLVETLKKKMSILNAENYGAVPLLGLKGIVLKAHGSSSSKAIAQAILAAVRAVQQKAFVNKLYE
jgi:glycerol-3-phosphate acyltransferase PlsX